MFERALKTVALKLEVFGLRLLQTLSDFPRHVGRKLHFSPMDGSGSIPTNDSLLRHEYNQHVAQRVRFVRGIDPLKIDPSIRSTDEAIEMSTKIHEIEQLVSDVLFVVFPAPDWLLVAGLGPSVELHPTCSGKQDLSWILFFIFLDGIQHRLQHLAALVGQIPQGLELFAVSEFWVGQYKAIMLGGKTKLRSDFLYVRFDDVLFRSRLCKSDKRRIIHFFAQLFDRLLSADDPPND